MVITDKFAYNSTLAWKDPVAKIIFAFASQFICIFFSNIFVSLIILLIMSGLVIYTSPDINLVKYIKILFIPISFLILGIIPILVVNTAGSSNILYILFGSYGITQASMYSSINLLFKSLSAVSCTFFLALSTPMTALFETLYRFKLPSLLVSLMELIYRYIFILIDEAYTIRQAQLSRLGYNSFMSKIKCTAELAAMLFIRSYIRAGNAYNALLSRGYNGELKTVDTSYESINIMYIYLFFVCVCSIILYIYTGSMEINL